MKPWHQVDGYQFEWPTLSGDKAQNFLLRFSDELIELTPKERIEKINDWLPAISDEKRAAKSGISAFDQHLVVTTLRTWREDQRERIKYA